MATKITRRQFFKLAAGTGISLALSNQLSFRGSGFSWGTPAADAFYQSSGLAKWATKLRGVGSGGIPVALHDAAPAPVTGALHYTINIEQFKDTLHPNLGPTTLRGYNPTIGLGGNTTPTHLGGIIVAKRGVPVQLTFRNNLPAKAILPVDTTVMGAEPGQPTNRTAVHIHGGFVPWISDGGPFTWWTPSGKHGASFLNNQVLNPGAAANEAEYYYPNNQSARLVWYHDHAFGITRLNAYSGIASAYIIRDDFEDNLRNLGLPDFVENVGRELPIIIQDKIFVDANTIDALDPTWPGPTTTGSLWYPHIYEASLYEIGPGARVGREGNLRQNPSIIPEMFGDTMLANGTVYPVAAVEPRLYRLRILNACQARFLNLQLYVDDGSPDGITLNRRKMTPTNPKGPDWLVIGTEGGFLAKPTHVPSNVPFSVASDADGNPIPSTIRASLLTGLAERWDVLVDFRPFAGRRIILYNDAPAPFPMGDPLNDYFLGAPGNPTVTNPGFGPNTRQIMAFQVGPVTGGGDTLHIDTHTDLTPGIDPSLVGLWTTDPLRPPSEFPVRHLTLNENYDALGRLTQRLGTWDLPAGSQDYGRAYVDPATEVVSEGATEVWQIANLTGDTHPMHFHLVNVQILSRRPFSNAEADDFNGAPIYSGPARGPEPTELGWKETVKMHPGEVTTVIMKFDLPSVPFEVPPSPRTGGHEYVWHCHILEHEEHDMMRPLIIT
jgi:spore coat protein A, manganese oxidase